MNWTDDVDIPLYDAERLNELDELRENDLVLWALVWGRRTSRAISDHIARPHKQVLWELRQYKADGIVADYEGRVSVEWRLVDIAENDYLLALRNWVKAQRVRGGLFNPPDENEGEG